MYIRRVRPDFDYLEYRSSVLGVAYLTIDSLTVLVSEKLDLNVIIAPGTDFEAFKKTASTICTARGWFV